MTCIQVTWPTLEMIPYTIYIICTKLFNRITHLHVKTSFLVFDHNIIYTLTRVTSLNGSEVNWFSIQRPINGGGR